MAQTLTAPSAPADGKRSRSKFVLLDRGDGHGPATGDLAAAVIRIVIADGHALVRAGLRALLESQQNITVAGEAADGEEAIALAREIEPDLVLMDLGIAGPDDMEVTRRVATDSGPSGTRVMVLAARETDEHVFGALRAGASGFLLKDTAPAHLVEAVRAVAAGEAVLSPSVARRLIAEFASQPEPHRSSPEQLEELTARELEVVTLVARGLSNHEIAEQLVVSPATAKTHVSRALIKLHARNRAQLVTLAYETGLVVARRQEAHLSSGPAPMGALVAA
jgi:DNA-binding NarL/FixJ family response regulator